MYQVQGQLSCTTGDGWESSRQIPTLAVPLATSARNAAEILADAVTQMRDSQSNIRVHVTVLDTDTDAVEMFMIEIG